jgi:hypothetical protein
LRHIKTAAAWLAYSGPKDGQGMSQIKSERPTSGRAL